MSDTLLPHHTIAGLPRLPLTPRSSNIPTPIWSPMSSFQKPIELPPKPFTFTSPPTSLTFSVPTSQRTSTPSSNRPPSRRSRQANIPTNPLTRPAPQQRASRREGYFRKLDSRRSEGNWNYRGEQILRQEFVDRWRAWEEAQDAAAPAPLVLDGEGDGDGDDDVSMDGEADCSTEYQQWSHGHGPPDGDAAMGDDRTEEEIEALLAAEKAEMDALLELHEMSQQQHTYQQSSRQETELPPVLDNREHNPWSIEQPSSELSRYGSEDEADFERALVEMDGMDVS